MALKTHSAEQSYRVRKNFRVRLPDIVHYALLIGSLSLSLMGCTADAIQHPISKGSSRTTVLTYGLHVTPDSAENPISPPERFSGYHVATDFEVTKAELDADVPVFAMCSGKVVYSGFAEGYGGLLVHRCTISGEPVTVIYGHLLLSSLPGSGTKVVAGNQIALLGPARSHDTDRNRKHLHLGIHRGKSLDIRGYVQAESDIASFIDPLSVIPPSAVLEDYMPDMIPYWKE